MPPLLFHLPYSPWSEKARWALDHHRIAYDKRTHVPMLGEPLLRWKLRRPRGRVTVPALVDGATSVRDSLEIARWAESRGAGTPLFPAGREADVLAWNERSEAALQAGRVLVTRRTAVDRAAKLDNLPVPPALRGVLEPVADLGVKFFIEKYGVLDRSADDCERVIAETLDAARNALADGGGDYLLGSFSYADIAVAVVLQFVDPVADRYIRLTDATRAVWATPALAEHAADLIAWRDRLYAEHR